MDIQDKIEIYSSVPYAGNGKIDDWFHVSFNDKRDHIEAVWDISDIFRPDIKTDIPIQGLQEHFETIRFHYALNRISNKYHVDCLVWAMKALKPGGKLQIVCPDLDYILKHWLKSRIQTEVTNLSIWQKIKQFFINEPTTVKQQLKNAGVPLDKLPAINDEEIKDFDKWLQIQLYSSGSGDPQDIFKSVFSKKYLSDILSETLLIIDKIETNPDDKSQIVAWAYRHPSRLL